MQHSKEPRMIIWITGASSGIGYATAKEYVKRGHTVFATARSQDKLQALRQECQGLPGHIEIAVGDVSDAAAVTENYRYMVEHLGMPDTVILNAGTHYPTPAETFSIEDHAKLMSINYIGTLNCLGTVLDDFKKRGKGQIAVVASLAGYRGLPKASAYGASKSALISLCESLKEELALFGIDLRLINPGFVKTPLTDENDFDMPFLMPLAKAPDRIIKGLASKRFEITFPTRFACILKLLRCLPYFIFFSLTRRMVRKMAQD